MTEVTAPPLARIASAFATARDQGRAALMPYLMAGFPDQETSLAVIREYAEAGADLVEIGVPFSDPLADGPVIHEAATRALEGGATFESALELCAAVPTHVAAVPMCYSNMVLAIGPERFADLLVGAGASGVIVPDMPLGEGQEIREALASKDLAMIPLVAPTTGVERRRQVCESASGFVYAVSDVGVTGERNELPPSLHEFVESLKAEAEVPVAVGFGIGTPEQAAAVGEVADGVIIGSRLVRAVAEAPGQAEAVAAVGEFLRSTRAALSA